MAHRLLVIRDAGRPDRSGRMALWTEMPGMM